MVVVIEIRIPNGKRDGRTALLRKNRSVKVAVAKAESYFGQIRVPGNYVKGWTAGWSRS